MFHAKQLSVVNWVFQFKNADLMVSQSAQIGVTIGTCRRISSA